MAHNVFGLCDRFFACSKCSNLVPMLMAKNFRKTRVTGRHGLFKTNLKNIEYGTK